MSEAVCELPTTAGSEGDVTERVRAFYERFHFPLTRHPDQSGLILMRRLRRLVTDAEETIRVLDVGCGTGNTMRSLAKHLPECRFVGTDISDSSLAIARSEARRDRLRNTEFIHADLLAPLDGRPIFDVVLCLGVLHHTADMQRALTRLAEALAPNGELYLWVYGRYGRYRHSLNCRFLNVLLDPQDDWPDRIRLAQEFALCTGAGRILEDLMEGAAMAGSPQDLMTEPAWIADQFLHPLEQHLDLRDLQVLAKRAGLQIREWLGVRTDWMDHVASSLVRARLEKLAEEDRLAALDLLLKPPHYFLLLGHGVAT